MLLDIVVIVLREMLEVSVLVGVLLSAGNAENGKDSNNKNDFSWLLTAVLIGTIGAILYALNLAQISEMFDYVGQEVVSASIQFIMYFTLLTIIFIWCVGSAYSHSTASARLLMSLKILAVALAITREGSELFVFYSGFLHAGDNLLSAATSGFIGLAVGLSAGAIVYYALVTQVNRSGLALRALVLSLVSCGLVIQATQLLIQADWLTASQPLWNTSGLLSETSIAGQIIYALFGYEATPSKQEVVAYFLAVVLILASVLVANWRSKQNVIIDKS